MKEKNAFKYILGRRKCPRLHLSITATIYMLWKNALRQHICHTDGFMNRIPFGAHIFLLQYSLNESAQALVNFTSIREVHFLGHESSSHLYDISFGEVQKNI